MKGRMLFIFNPRSGKGQIRNKLMDIIDVFVKGGYEVVVHPTQGAKDAEKMAKIMAEETERMILATKQLFYAMEIHKILHFQDADMSAVSFAMTVHGLMDYGLDKQTGKYEAADRKKDLMDEYLKWFCEENAVERNREDTEQRV